MQLKEPLTSLWTMVDGLSLHARRSTINPLHHEPNVVLVHGLGVSSRYMVPFASELAPYFPVFAPDLPGFGRSDHPWTVLDVPALGRALAAWIESLKVEPVCLFGNSAGCQIVAECAAHYPHLTRCVVLQGPTVEPGERTYRQQLARWWQNKEPRSMKSILVKDYAACGIYRLFRTFHHILADRIEDNLPNIAVPALVVRGTSDPQVSQAWAEQVTRLLPQGRLALIPGGSHTLNYSFPAELAKIVIDFLADLNLDPPSSQVFAPRLAPSRTDETTQHRQTPRSNDGP